MGLFSSKTRTYVSSSVYNLAGDIEDRADYLQLSLLNAVLSHPPSTGVALTNSYLKGPGIRLRTFGSWARNGSYANTVGIVTSALATGNNVDTDVLAAEIYSGAGTVAISRAEIDYADYTYWVDQYVLANHPELATTAYSSDVDDNNLVTITYEDESTETFSLTNFTQDARYLYVAYSITEDSGEQLDPVVGDVETLTEYPDVSDYDQDSYDETVVPVTLTTTVTTDVTYSDGTDPTQTVDTTTEDTSYTDTEAVYSQTVQLDQDGSELIEQLQTLTVTQSGSVETVTTVDVVEEVVDGVTVTTTTTTETEQIVYSYTSQLTTQDTVLYILTPTQLFIYRYGTGNATLDAMFTPTASIGTFLPFVPFRLNNEWAMDIYDGNNTVVNDLTNAIRMALDTRYAKIQDSIADNDSLGDLDYVYAVFGASLNTPDNAARMYIYEFFDFVFNQGTADPANYNDFVARWEAASASYLAYKEWLETGSRRDPAPTLISYPTISKSSITMRSNKNVMNFNINLAWNYMSTESGTGQLTNGDGEPAKKKDTWIVAGSEEDGTLTQYTVVSYEEDVSSNSNRTRTVTKVQSEEVDVGVPITIYQQVTDDTWRSITVGGLVHTNRVYDGKSVVITSSEALADDEESGFIIPIHEDIFASMEIVDSTQMAQAACYLMFNCYQQVKTKWYQSGWFKVVLVVIIIVVSVYTGGAGAGAASSTLGGSIAAAAGLTGIAATIAAVVINTLASMIISMVIQAASKKLFGEKVGAIVGAIASFVTMSVANGMSSGMTFSEAVGSMASADNLLLLTNAAGQGYTGYMQAVAADYQGRIEKMEAEYADRQDELKAAYNQFINTDLNGFDPISMFTQFTDSAIGSFNESEASFIGRTLMTGDDIAQLSLDMIDQYADLSLSLDLDLI